MGKTTVSTQAEKEREMFGGLEMFAFCGGFGGRDSEHAIGLNGLCAALLVAGVMVIVWSIVSESLGI